MSASPQQKDRLAAIARGALGPEASASRGEKVNVTRDALRAAIEASYQEGVREGAPKEGQVDPDLFFWQLMDSLPDNVYFKDTRSRFICVNRAQAHFLGVDEPNDAIGKSDFDFFEEQHALERFNDEQAIMRTGKGWTLHEEKDLVDETGKACVISCKLPLRDVKGNIYGTFGISRDITNRYLAEREVERQRNLLEAIIQILPCRIFVRDLESRFILVNEAYCKAMGAEHRDEILGRALSDFGNQERHKKIAKEDELVRNEGQSILNKIGFDKSALKKQRWVVTSKVPLRGPDGSVEGVVGMTYDITEQKDAEEKARELSQQLQYKNEQFEAELLVARQLQEMLMSIGFDKNRRYSKTGSAWRADASYYYKASHHLAGDFFDLIPISQNKLGVLVCDVMGHGVKAALVTMLLRGLILEMPKLLDQPDRVLTRLNASLSSLAEDQEFPRFTTAIYMTIDLESGVARLANAGHPQPVWRTRSSGEFVPCPSPSIGPALGIIPDEQYEQLEFAFSDVTELLLYTDGIIEQKDAAGREFGAQSLGQIPLVQEEGNIFELLHSITTALHQTAGSSDFDDDLCLIALKLLPNQNWTSA